MTNPSRHDHSSQGIARDRQAQEQPTDKKRAQSAHHSDPKKSASREATRDPKLSDAEKTPGSGMTSGDAPSG
jgi:hypothetical protein